MQEKIAWKQRDLDAMSDPNALRPHLHHREKEVEALRR
jgi:hypothetical protein